ncbi:BON domain-containing protein [Oligoflexus tunisiensis]|uniref:BON domain-containing protein n=1 Tax=Oligoflexus tunisiensis TaxID=708132 RepID=UPI00159F1F16|nr:BON domain-containing protein [Oligoflexus tunisiensis]
MSEQQDKHNQKTEKEADMMEERGLGGMGSDGDSMSPDADSNNEQRRSIDFLRASDVAGAEGWEGGEPRTTPQEEKRSHRWGPKGNAGLGPKGYRRSDDSIKEDVCERLTQDPVIDASDVEVHVQDGEVTLTGTVAGRIEKSRAEDIILDIRGVKNVENRLKVEGASQTPRDDAASFSGAGAP